MKAENENDAAVANALAKRAARNKVGKYPLRSGLFMTRAVARGHVPEPGDYVTEASGTIRPYNRLVKLTRVEGRKLWGRTIYKTRGPGAERRIYPDEVENWRS